MASILPIYDTCVNYGRGFYSSSCYEQKPLSDFENSSSFARNHSRKRIGQTDEKKTVFEFGGAVLQGEGGFQTPMVVNGIGRGG
jgi:hypothetical protein